jgi:hypothetical protein
MNIKTETLFKDLIDKGLIKQKVYTNTLESFQLFKDEVLKLAEVYAQKWKSDKIVFEYTDKSAYEFQLKFAGDILIFLMHTNVFEIPRQHELMRTSYIKNDKNRSYCGMIHIYNFIADSFKYDRDNDLGYLIGRIYINHEKHFHIEGKKEIGMIYNRFDESVLNIESAHEILTSAIEYTINFDLLIPPFEAVKTVSVYDIRQQSQSLALRTAKRLGFKFNSDKKEIKGHTKNLPK